MKFGRNVRLSTLRLGDTYIVDSPQRNPKGCKESSRWSESAETTGKVVSYDRTPKGCQTSQ
jgi:hypothetical protein